MERFAQLGKSCAPFARGDWNAAVDIASTVGHSIVFTFRFITPFWDFFGRLKTVPLDRDNGTFNSSNTDVVEKVNFLVAA